MKRTLTLAVASALLATLLSSTVAAAAVPSNDLPDGAIALSEVLPQTVVADTTEATVSTDDVGCGAGGVDQASVWYSITTSNGLDILIDATASSYLVGVNLFVTSPGQENLIACFQGPGFVTLEAGITYYLMFADTELDTINGGALSVTLEVPPPPIEITMTIDPTGTVDRLGNVTIGGSITCTEQASFAELSAFLRQNVGRFTFTGNGSAAAECGPTPSSWTLSASSQNGKFGGGKVLVDIRAFACSTTSCAGTGTSGTVRLGR